jgi:hypothetical protein
MISKACARRAAAKLAAQLDFIRTTRPKKHTKNAPNKLTKKQKQSSCMARFTAACPKITQRAAPLALSSIAFRHHDCGDHEIFFPNAKNAERLAAEMVSCCAKSVVKTGEKKQKKKSSKKSY